MINKSKYRVRIGNRKKGREEKSRESLDNEGFKTRVPS